VAVESDGGDGVEAVGDEFNHLLVSQVCWRREPGLVFPVALFDPLKVQLVGPIKWIRDAFGAAQVGVYAARDKSR
jgi:hypothetical protein